jgi:hypothetical protein
MKESLRLIDPVRNNQEPPWCLAFSNNGEFLAAGGYDGTVTVWHIGSAQVVFSQNICRMVSFSADTQRIEDMCFSASDNRLGILFRKHLVLLSWKQQKGDSPLFVMKKLPAMAHFAVDLSMTTSEVAFGNGDGTVGIAETATVSPVWEFTLKPAGYSSFQAVKFMSKGTLIGMIGDDLYVINRADKQLLYRSGPFGLGARQFYNGRYIPLCGNLPLELLGDMHPDDDTWVLAGTFGETHSIVLVSPASGDRYMIPVEIKPHRVRCAEGGYYIVTSGNRIALFQDDIELNSAAFNEPCEYTDAAAISRDAAMVAACPRESNEISLFATGLKAAPRPPKPLLSQRGRQSSGPMFSNHLPQGRLKKKVFDVTRQVLSESLDGLPVFWSNRLLLKGCRIHLFMCGTIRVERPCYFVWIDRVPLRKGAPLPRWAHPVTVLLIPEDMAPEKLDVYILQAGGPFTIPDLISISVNYHDTLERHREFLLSDKAVS